jgi:sugar phosphate isomerase/epimerase
VELSLYRTRWGTGGTLDHFVAEALAAGFDGIECPAPASVQAHRELEAVLGRLDAGWIAEIATGGGYVPQRDRSLQAHVEDLRTGLDACAPLAPVRVNCIGGLDAWPDDDVLRFLDAGMGMAESLGLELCFETHRSRCLFNPWRCERIVGALPEIRLTADLSHWCVVAERLMDTEMSTIRAIAPRVRHIHARVGYDQGPQVPHPAAPEYAAALASHQHCWEVFWEAQQASGTASTTMTPEFGCDGYLHLLPFTRAPVADLWEINRWMADTERRHFDRWRSTGS